MTINEFIKQCKKVFGNDIQYKATSKNGQIFKTKRWKDDKVNINQRQLTSAYRETKKS